MRIFVAGATGAIGRELVPLLVHEGHEVVGLARGPARAAADEALGARAAVADAFDRDALAAAVEQAAPEVVIHQLTALTGAGNPKRFDQEFARTNRLRTEVTDTLLAAARRAGARRFLAQSYCGWPFAREGGPVKTEDAPLDPHPPAAFRLSFAAIRYLEETVRASRDLDALALRYGAFYGPGTGFASDGVLARMVRARKFPLVGDGAGVWSFLHVRDAARATAAAATRGAPGIYNITDDDPAPVSEWLPAFAQALGARPPRRLPAWLARLAVGAGGVSLMTLVRGGSNAKAKRELLWEPAYPSWRRAAFALSETAPSA